MWNYGYRTFNYKGEPTGYAGIVCAWLIARGMVSFKDSLSVEDTEFFLSKTRQEIEEMAGRGRKPATAAVAKQLMEALDFVKPATRDTGQYANHDHVRIEGNFITAFNGIIAMAAPIEEDIDACPHFDKLYQGLAKCGKSLSITVTDGGKLSLKGDNLKAVVPCVSEEETAAMSSGFPMANFDMTAIVKAITTVGILAEEDAPTVLESSVLLQANTCIATDRRIAVEAWHGLNMPTLILPKAFVQVISKIKKQPSGFNFTETSFCIFYDDNSWIKTQLYVEAWPDVSRLLDVATTPKPVPDKLFEGLKAVIPHCDNDTVYFKNGAIWTHESDKEGAQFEVAGLEGERCYNPEYWLRVSHLMNMVDFTADPEKAYFFLDNEVRGVIMSKKGHSEGQG
jgi:hypothetical protein